MNALKFALLAPGRLYYGNFLEPGYLIEEERKV
jgi:hypothetical protein